MCSQMGQLPPTRDDEILLIPHESSENGVESVGGIRNENDFVGSCADEFGQAMSGGSEVVGKT